MVRECMYIIKRTIGLGEVKRRIGDIDGKGIEVVVLPHHYVGNTIRRTKINGRDTDGSIQVMRKRGRSLVVENQITGGNHDVRIQMRNTGLKDGEKDNLDGIQMMR